MLKVDLIGRLGKDPESKSDGAKTKVSFSMAVDAGKDQSGNKKTAWFTVHVFGKDQGFVLEHLKKGNEVYVTGKADLRAYVKDGTPVATGDVFASIVQKVGWEKKDATLAPAMQASPHTPDDIPPF